MAEYPINPKHNVFKKYRTVNYINSYVFAPPVDLTTNTEIGGVASTINTPALLATKLDIDVSRITNFSIVGNDIKCRITGSYNSIGFDNNSSITYLYDNDGLQIQIGFSSQAFFRNCPNIIEIKLPSVIYNQQGQFSSNPKLKRLLLNGLINKTSYNTYNSSGGSLLYLPELISTAGFDEINTNSFGYFKNIYIPKLKIIGGTSSTNNGFFSQSPTGVNIWIHPDAQTSNSGAMDADLAWVIANKAAVVTYGTKSDIFTLPNPVTTLSAGTIYNTAVQLNFTPPSSANTIDYYELYSNGVFVKNISVSGAYLTGLAPSTSYNITLIAVDVFYNKSIVSNILSVSTTAVNPLDSDANAYIAASGNTAYSAVINDLYCELKANSLYAKLQAFYPFLGTTAAQHKWNGKNPLDTNAAFRLTFSGGGAFSDLGFQCNGSNSFANTYFAPSANQNVNSNGLTVVIGTNNTVNNDNCTVGSYNSESQMTVFTSKGNNTTYYRQSLLNNRSSAIIQTGVNEARGVWTASKQFGNFGKLFRNGTSLGSGSGGGLLPTYNLYIGALNYIGSLNGVSHQRIQFTAFHEGLSDAEVATLHTIIDTFETALGRKTW